MRLGGHISMTQPGFPSILRRPLISGLCVFGLFTTGVFAQTPSEKTFSIPASTAEKSLKQFVAQSGVQVVYPAAVVRGVPTPEVKGRMIPAVAIKRLLDGTGLASAQDERTGAFSISRRPLPNG